MGDNAVNIIAGAHSSGGVRQGYRVHYHYGSTVNTSGDATPTAWANLKLAVANNAPDNDLDQLGATAWGSWYTTWISGTGSRADLRVSLAG